MKKFIKNFVFLFVLLPSISFASEHGDMSFEEGIKSLTAYYINSFIFFVALFFILRAGVKKFFIERRNAIKNQIEEAKNIFEETTKRYEKAKERQENLEEELKNIREEIIDEANRRADEIVNVANEKAEYLKENAKQMIMAEEKKALASLSREFSGMLIESTKQEIVSSLNNEVKDKLIDEGISNIKNVVNG